MHVLRLHTHTHTRTHTRTHTHAYTHTHTHALASRLIATAPLSSALILSTPHCLTPVALAAARQSPYIVVDIAGGDEAARRLSARSATVKWTARLLGYGTSWDQCLAMTTQTLPKVRPC